MPSWASDPAPVGSGAGSRSRVLLLPFTPMSIEQQALENATTAADLERIEAYRQAREDYDTIQLIDGKVPEPFEGNLYNAEAGLEALIGR